MPDIISRVKATSLGLDRYFTGKPCKSGHLAERRVMSCHCTECASIASVASASKDVVRRRENQNAFRASNPDKIRGYRFQSKYGISLEERDKLFELQGKRCAVCRSDDPGSYGRWNTDHCHATNKVRGILCQPCNIALGFVRDSVPTLIRMIAYLEQNQTVADAHASTHAGNADAAAAQQAQQQVPA